MSIRKIVVLYGSQTGTAQDIAERIWREAKFYGFTGPLMEMDSYCPEDLIYEPLVVFVASTTGQGEEPDNMKLFWKFLLRKSLPVNSLRHTSYAVLGLGDSSYVKFNFVAKRLTRRLSDLGARRVVDTGYADDQHDLGIDAVVDKWLLNLWTALGSLFKFTVEPCTLNPSPRWSVSYVSRDTLTVNGSDNEEGNDLKRYSQRHPCPLHILDNQRTTAATHFQDVRLLKFSHSALNYNPGDVLMLAPQNTDESVNLLFKILNENRTSNSMIDEDSMIKVEISNLGLAVPEPLERPISLRECARKYWDLNAVPRRRVFSLLAFATSNELEKEKLDEFSEATGLEDLYNYCNRPRRTILEVLADFPFVARDIKLDLLFDIFQPIRPRAFSLASSPKKHCGELHVLLAVVQYKTNLLTPRHGLCSTYLASLPKGSTVHGWIQPGSFHFPPPGTPVIMVGPGTGVAPFRGYIHHACSQTTSSSSNLLLFFGCRSEFADFHCQDEWEQLVAEGQLTLVTAFSRDQSNKVYVQHRINEHETQVWEMLSRGGFIFVAGSSKNMPGAVRESFKNVIRRQGSMSEEKAELFVRELERAGRYQTETWS